MEERTRIRGDVGKRKLLGERRKSAGVHQTLQQATVSVLCSYDKLPNFCEDAFGLHPRPTSCLPHPVLGSRLRECRLLS